MKKTNSRDARLPGRLGQLAWLLDSSIRLPGLNFRIGLDALIGLVPGVGDIIGMLLSSYIVREAWRLGVPRSTLLRMGFNVMVEGVLGAIPLVGDVFDAAWKANQRNVRLLDAHLRNPRAAARASGLFMFLLFALLLVLIVGAGALAYLLLRALFNLGAA